MHYCRTVLQCACQLNDLNARRHAPADQLLHKQVAELLAALRQVVLSGLACLRDPLGLGVGGLLLALLLQQGLCLVHGGDVKLDLAAFEHF